MTSMLLIVVAPFAEEFFFRGFLYRAFRNSFGVLPGALLSAVIFGAILEGSSSSCSSRSSV